MVKRNTRVPISIITLRALAGVSAMTIAVLAPKMTRLLTEFDQPEKNRTKLYNRINGSIARLERSGLVAISGIRGQRRITLTEKGRTAAKEAEYENAHILEPAFWDGKWRIVMFDVREGRRRTRDQLRRMLKNAGFVYIQDSVWAHPFPCDEFISLVRAHLKSGVGELRSFVAEALESDKALRTHFKL